MREVTLLAKLFLVVNLKWSKLSVPVVDNADYTQPEFILPLYTLNNISLTFFKVPAVSADS